MSSPFMGMSRKFSAEAWGRNTKRCMLCYQKELHNRFYAVLFFCVIVHISTQTRDTSGQCLT